jgi:hypothetical protein
VTRLQAAWVDDLYPLRKMVEDLAGNQPIDYTRNGYVLARLARGASAKADGFLRHGVRAADGTFIAPALEPALKPVRKQIKEFATYLAALRAQELRGRGMETGMSLAEARRDRREVHQSPDVRRGARRGLRLPGRAAALRARGRRAVGRPARGDQGVEQSLRAVPARHRRRRRRGGSGTKRGIANKANPVKRIKGSGRDIINPLESIVRNTHTLVSMVEQNRAMQALVARRRRRRRRPLSRARSPRSRSRRRSTCSSSKATSAELDRRRRRLPRQPRLRQARDGVHADAVPHRREGRRQRHPRRQAEVVCR